MTQKKSQLQTAGEVLLPATGVASTAYLTGLAYDEIQVVSVEENLKTEES